MRQRQFRPSSQPRAPWRPRLLVEDPSPALQQSEFRLFEDAGFEVALCSGPCGDEECDLVAAGDCRLVDEADVVLMGPGMAERRTEVAAAIQQHRPEVPVVVQVPRAEVEQCPPGCVANACPSSVDGQIRALWSALDQPPAAPGPSPSTAVDPTLARLIDLLGW
jgi:hypothetical protein